jgi:purine-binding chemotaxis protein CheW
MTGLLVDAVSDIVTFPNDELRPPPEIASHTGANVIKALTLIDERMIRVLNLPRILETDVLDAA